MSEGFVAHYINDLPRSDRVALDVGANHGLYTVQLVNKFKHVYAFEPEPGNSAQLHRGLNALEKSQRNVTIEQAAVGIVDGEVELYLNDNPGGHTINRRLAEERTWGHKTEAFITVRCLRLDTYCADMDVGFIKCDVEAGESFIFEGAEETLRRCKPVVMLEVHESVDYERLFNYFTGLGYEFITERWQRVDKIISNNHYMVRPYAFL